MSENITVVCGGGGFIGGHLAGELIRQGKGKVRSVDIKPLKEWYQRHDGVENVQLDLRDLGACRKALAGATTVFNLAADMGGMGFIETHNQHAFVDGGEGGGCGAVFLCVVGVRIQRGQAA
jgi:GDP-D-mannose 3', 5'-epimerase